VILGHEGGGIVESIGEDVTHVKPGMTYGCTLSLHFCSNSCASVIVHLLL